MVSCLGSVQSDRTLSHRAWAAAERWLAGVMQEIAATKSCCSTAMLAGSMSSFSSLS